MPGFFKLLTPLLLLLIAPLATAQTLEEQEAAEAQKREAFQQGAAALVESLNQGSFRTFTRAIRKDEFLERTFGLKLIDAGIKREIREDMETPSQWNAFVESFLAEEAEKGIKATLLLVESRGDRGRALVRYDMSFFRANYHEYDLQLSENGRIYIIDWNDYLWGHQFTDRLGLTLIQAKPNENAARKLLDLRSIREMQIFQTMEILKATRDRDFERYQQIIDAMDETLRQQRVIIKLGLDTARAARKRRPQRAALELVAEYYANDPFFALALMDFYIPEKRYQEALDTLAALQKHLRVDDALLNARMSSILLAMEKVDEAHALAMKSVEQEEDLELGWWSVFRARVTAEDYASSLEALEILEDRFGNSLGPDALSKDPMFRPLMLSPEYRVWFEESD